MTKFINFLALLTFLLITFGIFLFLPAMAFAKNVNVSCWSGENLIFNGIYSEENILMMDNYIILKNRSSDLIVLADCILSERKNNQKSRMHKHPVS